MLFEESSSSDFVDKKKQFEEKENPLAAFEIGSVVRVVVEGLKMYQVPPKGHGSFDKDKKFVPVEKGGGRNTKNLVLPVGLRGVVADLCTDDSLSSNLPVTVKFTPGENIEEGYDPPVPFLAHFDPCEIEVVSD